MKRVLGLFLVLSGASLWAESYQYYVDNLDSPKFSLYLKLLNDCPRPFIEENLNINNSAIVEFLLKNKIGIDYNHLISLDLKTKELILLNFFQTSSDLYGNLKIKLVIVDHSVEDYYYSFTDISDLEFEKIKSDIEAKKALPEGSTFDIIINGSRINADQLTPQLLISNPCNISIVINKKINHISPIELKKELIYAALNRLFKRMQHHKPSSQLKSLDIILRIINGQFHDIPDSPALEI